MYIKQIIIQGFKSYKEQTIIEPFSPKTNVVVGRNGSGKSNFFAAIRFVLGDAYTQMGREERQALLHEGSGSAVTSAYVEIIFDNSDRRFPTEKDELVLRRTIGLKKDEYSLDRKNATKSDVMNLLEAAGFSRSNPYYIVPQGRVTALTNMKDGERLTLLKEVAGTQVYEARRSESVKIMTETNNKRAKIDELLDYIKDRLSGLEKEKDELRGYQEKDKERRCLEYAFYHREQIALASALEDADEVRQTGGEGSDEVSDALAEGERAIAEMNSEIQQLNRDMELLILERRQMDEERRDNAKKQAKVELEVKSIRDGLSSTEQARLQHTKELKAVKKDIASKEAELEKLLPEFNKRQAKEAEVKESLDAAEISRRRLLDKQGRVALFKTKAERDKFLKNEIQETITGTGEQKANRINANEEVSAGRAAIESLEAEIASLRERYDGWGANRQAVSDAVSAAADALEKLQEEKKVLRREEDKLESVIRNARSERDAAEKELSSTMDGQTSRALASVANFKREQNITGAYGTLAELLEVSETYRLAVEQTAGNSLFHYVVDTDDTAKLLVDHLYQQRQGRLTFVPLNRINIRPHKLPKASDAQPMIEKITFDKKYTKAMEQVFGKTVICPNLIIAGQYARSHGCSAVTMDGDTTNKRGAMTGGYIDPRKSRLTAVRAVNKWRDEYESLRQRRLDIEKQILAKDQETTAALSERQKKDQQRRQLDDGLEPLQREIRLKTSHLERSRDQLASNIKRQQDVERILKENDNAIAGFEAEMASEFKKALTAQEEAQLDKLNSSIPDLQKEWNEVSKSRRELDTRKRRLEVDLKENLRLKLDDLTSQAIDTTASNDSGALKESERNLDRILKKTANIETRLHECETQIEEAERKTSSIQKEIAQKQSENDNYLKLLEKHKKMMEKTIQRKALLLESAAECAKNIRDLGVLPEEAFERFANTSSEKIQSRLRKVNEALKKFKGVNKKAFEQYSNFTSQRDSLTKRRKELDDSQASIQDLIEALDQRKDEAIQRTFKQVSKEFATIFERLVPAGRGRLVIQRKTDQRAPGEESEDEPDRSGKSIENFTGVGISVSFNSKHDEQQRIQQLSGGQKSLCALALVFAIQQCDPAPFYLFDEIDANLDAQYRTAVAQMLEDISAQQHGEGGSKSGQFICTTFRPEMLLVADKCYGVTFHNKTSRIDVASREAALEFVDGQAPK